MESVGNTGGDPRPNVVCLEGNGTRPSHRGCAISDSGIMYTLNSTEVHIVAYAVDCRNFTESEINGTLQSKSNGGVSINYNNVVHIIRKQSD